MTSVSAGHIILTPIQLIGNRQPQRGSNPGPRHLESRALDRDNDFSLSTGHILLTPIQPVGSRDQAPDLLITSIALYRHDYLAGARAPRAIIMF